MRRVVGLLVVAFFFGGGGVAAAALSPGDHVSYVTGATPQSGVLLVQTPTLDLVARDGTTSTQDQVAPSVVKPSATPTPTPTPTPSPTATPTATPTPTGSDPVVTAAGDIAGGDAGTNDTATGDVVRSVNPDVALTLGDNAYVDGTLSDYQNEYGPAWGSFKAKTRPAAGNHDYETGNANGLFDYFNGVGVQTGPAGDRTKGVYYSFNLGGWHLIALDNYVPMAAGSAQETWLRQDLAANAGRCTLAYWHEPRFTSGSIHSPNTSTQPLWNDLYAAHADVVLNGHNHQYERFALQNPSGQADANGIREFVVGTGGQGQYAFNATLAANSQVHQTGTWGVLRLTLHPGSYDWKFMPIAGQTWTDSGSQSCHASGGAAATPTPTPTATPSATATPTPTPTPTGTPSYAMRGMYDRNSSGGFADIAATGIDLIDSGPGTVDDLTGNLKGLTWVGDYDNSTCSWEVSDATLRSDVQAHVGDPKVGVWFISDEPDPHACPNAYAQHAARTALIHSIDPKAKTLVVLDGNSGNATLNQLDGWRGTADVFGLDPYPCLQGSSTCDDAWIDTVAQAADVAGLPYWGVVQAFGDAPGSGQWRLPSASELHTEFVHWRATNMKGYLVFAWRWPSGTSSLWLQNHPELQQQLKIENGS